ncbi:hypothetical protein [Caldivirga sp.]|uniref:hypothetical protein n=1 Tax=Caldivirga sp. TaxID=2080243 RepID=UPI003D0E7962
MASSFSKPPSSVGVHDDEKDVKMNLETIASLRPVREVGGVAAVQYPLRNDDAIYFAVAVSETKDDALAKVKEHLNKAGEAIRHMAEEYESKRVKVTGGEFSGVAQAIMDAVSRNTVWDPYNARMYTGLVGSGLIASYEFALRSTRLFMNERLREGHYHENYNAENGDGDDVFSSDPYYSWGALLALISLEELIDVDENGIKFSPLGVKDTNEVRNYSIGGDAYSLKINPSIIEASRNGKVFFRASKAVVVRNYRKLTNYVKFHVRGYGTVNLNIELGEGRTRHVMVMEHFKPLKDLILLNLNYLCFVL